MDCSKVIPSNKLIKFYVLQPHSIREKKKKKKLFIGA